MPITALPDKYSETISKLADRGFTSEDIFLTMRFSDLGPESLFPATMAFGNSRLFLYTGISQCQRQAEALQKYKEANYKPEMMNEKDRSLLPRADAKYEPKEVDDFLKKWGMYDPLKPPDDPANIVVIINYLQTYNAPLQWWASAFEPIQRAAYNVRYAVGSRTFKALITLGQNMFQREQDRFSIGEKSHRSFRHPLGEKQEE